MSAFVALGSNMGEREGYLRAAIDAISKTETVLKTSSIYETDPVGFLDQPPFLNMVIEVGTSKNPTGLFSRLMDIEVELHRVRSFPNSPRTIDIDLILFGDAVVETPNLTIPHPRMHERAFVLVPLVEIAPDVVVPTFGQAAHELLDALGDLVGVFYWGEY